MLSKSTREANDAGNKCGEKEEGHESLSTSLFGAWLPLVMGLVQGPDELPLVVFGVSRHIGPRGHHFESHHLQGIEDQPGG